MGITMMFKLLTTAGRREVARELVKPYVTIENIAREVSHGTCALVDKGTAKLDDAKCKKMSVGFNLIATGCSTIGTAIDPNGDAGKAISDAEREDITGKMRAGIEIVLTPEILDNIIESAVARIP